jgi:RHS repeat-associated protein
VTEYQYEESGELLMNTTTPDGAVTNYGYISNGEDYGLSSISYPESIQQFFEYRGDVRLSEVYLDGEEELIRYTYDVSNKTTYITDAEGNIATIHVDEFGQITWLGSPLGTVTQYEYGEDLNLIRTTDPLGNAYNFSYDERGNIVSVTNSLNHEITMEYNLSFNKLTGLRDARGNEIAFEYDEYGNLLSTTYPDSCTEFMDYDSVGNLINVTTRKDDTINYTYNSKGQLVRKDYPDGSWIAYEYDDAGNMISATDKGGTIEMEYNTRDLLTKITYPTGYFFDYSYDDAGRLIRRVDQDGKALNYEYDAASRLVRISNESDSDIVRYEYDAVGRLIKKTLGSGASAMYEYDAAGQILHLINYNISGEVLSRFDYTYDLQGNPVSVNTLGGTYSYEYDSTGQLTKVTYPDGHNESYSYDAAGNRIAVIDDGNKTNYTTNNMNQYTEVGNVSYSYDANGNRISKTEGGQTTTYQYNFENRLTKVTSPEGTWEYIYNAMGNRVGVVHNGTEHRYLVDPMGLGNVVAEYDGNGALTARYVHGLGLISKIDYSGNPYYYHFNPTGHTMQITDENGGVVNSYKYSPFGISLEKEETITNPFGYVGEFGVMDDGNGLNYMRMRYYQPELGRFSSEDPLMIPGENGYAYVRNSPIKYVDPFGLQLVQRVGKAIRGFLKFIENCLYSFVDVPGLPGLPGLSHLATLAELEKESPGTIEDFSRGLNILTNGYYGYSPSLRALEEYEQYYDGQHHYDDHTQVDSMPVQSVSSSTPEDKYGPTGYDHLDTPLEERKRFVLGDQNFYYKVDFWNKENATAPACDVFVADQLDSNLNWSTFRFKEIGLLNWTVELEPCQYFNVYVDTRPEMDLIVNVEGTFDLETGEINWTFWSLDSDTLETPDDPMAGFLPPITESGYEIGWVCFSVDPESELTTGTQIENQAFVEFDWAGDLLDHPAPKEGPWINTIDAAPPTSNMTAVLLNETEIQLNWTGEDDVNGSGIKDYAIYVSEDGELYMPLLVNTNKTSTVFEGESGHSYAFYSIARDNVGNVEEAPEEPDAMVVCPSGAEIFDTGTPANPYPSIAGTHNGTIKLKVTIEVSTLYTYSCAGTGGHTEYARIWNNTGFNATAKWEGYKGDWHNISFDKNFMLVADETYNYTIRTGSYPQIHHTDKLEPV